MELTTLAPRVAWASCKGSGELRALLDELRSQATKKAARQVEQLGGPPMAASTNTKP